MKSRGHSESMRYADTDLQLFATEYTILNQISDQPPNLITVVNLSPLIVYSQTDRARLGEENRNRAKVRGIVLALLRVDDTPTP